MKLMLFVCADLDANAGLDSAETIAVSADHEMARGELMELRPPCPFWPVGK